MTAAKVIEEILHLPREEQSRVLEFVFELARKRQLSGKELSGWRNGWWIQTTPLKWKD